MSTTKSYRAYDETTGWRGPIRATVAEATRDGDAHDEGCRAQGGYGSAQVIGRDPASPDYAVWVEGEQTGETVWPRHGRSTGAVRFESA